MDFITSQTQIPVPTVLVVDDTAANLEMLGAMLRVKNIQILASLSGKQALAIAEAKKPDIILLDVQMPEMDGYEVCAALKANPTTKDIPVIFLTAKSETPDIIKGFDLGAVDYITKPFKPPELFARLQTHFELKVLQDDMAEKNRQLVELNKLKNEFLGVAVHDLKNPLAGISGIAEFLRTSPEIDREITEQCLDTIISQSNKMFAIIKNLLNINAIERGKVQLNIQDLNISALVQATVESYGLRAEGKSLTLTIHSNDSVFALGDEIATIQVLDNLISNAIKFSPQGKKIDIRIFEEPDSKTARVEICDEGPGINEIEQKKLFQSFSKLSAQPTAGESSTGLGLSIVKRMVEEMNGNVWCESTPGNGATFIVRLPLYKEQSESINQ